MRFRQIGDLIEVAEREDVSAVEAGSAVAGRRVQRVVAIVEELQAAAFVQRVRPGVGAGELQAIAHALGHADLERVVVGNTHGRIEVRVRVVADVGHAKRGVARRRTETRRSLS